ncbi:MAG: DNA repair protein RadA [Bacteroidota bacterium]
MPKTKFVCQACGSVQPRWMGKCPDCQQWNTLSEEALPTGKEKKHAVAAKAVPLTSVSLTKEERFSTGYGELDRVLGGGVVPGSLALLGGDPGIGKSTLLLQVAHSLGHTGKKVLYVSGEESLKQLRLRSNRLGKESNELLVLAETDLTAIAATLRELRPDWAVIDSIQTVFDPSVASHPGSISQIRDATGILMRLAKEEGLPLCIVGHVTKEGSIAGPKMLEHMVDTVLYFEGDRYKSHRLIRAVKNRFGSTNEVGVFEMTHLGLEEVLNPSQLFLAERQSGAVGSAIVPAMEGTRPLLVEIQALVCPSALAAPRRAATGIDYNRIVQVLAVLEKRVGIQMGKQDVYLNVVGGMRVDEPAADLACALAIASSARELPLHPTTVAIGEIGLSGELRGVNAVEPRLKEAAKLGFTRAILPSKPPFKVPGLEVKVAERLSDAIKLALDDK